MRIEKSVEIPQDLPLLQQLVCWANQEPVSCLLLSNNQVNAYGAYDYVFAAGAHESLQVSTGTAFEALKAFRKRTQDFILGYFSYDLKNELEEVKSENLDGLDFPDLFFFQPKKLWLVKKNEITCLYLEEYANELDADIDKVFNQAFQIENTVASEKPHIQVRFNRDAYCAQVSKMLDHIKRGDIYEANFCQEFYSEAAIDPVASFLHLNAISEAPFAAFFKNETHFALCSSPERFLTKRGTQLISQPIKGTAPRGVNATEDAFLARQLANDAKERTENIMITDLVRNDLSKKALKGSVRVEELCKIYSFKQVHQMISTISAQVDADEDPVALIKMAFPMGSMTGAPKVSAMHIIEQLENHKRGLYSGSIGYFEPNGDFDFNVMIRSILYNAAKPYVSFSVGSAITAQALPEKEYQECLLKAKAMREALEL